jgi:hypothetical protein
MQTDRDLLEILNEPPERTGGLASPAVDHLDLSGLDETYFNPPDDSYWRDRADLTYYRTAAEYVRRHSPHGRTLLDVGGGVQWGCRFLELLPEWDRTSLELPSDKGCRLDGVREIPADFLAWRPDRQYDVVTCLQVLEHIPDAVTFARKLLTLAPVMVVSVPYRWPRGTVPSHVHDPVDEQKLRGWMGCEPIESLKSGSPLARLVAVYLTP